MGLDAIGIACKDIQKSLEFYALFHLAFKKLGEDHYEATTPQGLRIMLDSHDLLRKINPLWEVPVHPGITLCFGQDNPEAVDELFSQISKAGFQEIKTPWDAFWGQRYASVLDPDGNQIDIFAALD